MQRNAIHFLKVCVILLAVLAIAEAIAFASGLLLSILLGVSKPATACYDFGYSIWFCIITAFAFLAYFALYFLQSNGRK